MLSTVLEVSLEDSRWWCEGTGNCEAREADDEDEVEDDREKRLLRDVHPLIVDPENIELWIIVDVFIFSKSGS
jgi:hypothetical protein